MFTDYVTSRLKQKSSYLGMLIAIAAVVPEIRDALGAALPALAAAGLIHTNEKGQ